MALNELYLQVCLRPLRAIGSSLFLIEMHSLNDVFLARRTTSAF